MGMLLLSLIVVVVRRGWLDRGGCRIRGGEGVGEEEFGKFALAEGDEVWLFILLVHFKLTLMICQEKGRENGDRREP